MRIQPAARVFLLSERTHTVSVGRQRQHGLAGCRCAQASRCVERLRHSSLFAPASVRRNEGPRHGMLGEGQSICVFTSETSLVLHLWSCGTALADRQSIRPALAARFFCQLQWCRRKTQAE